VAKVLKG